jgi:hypothetical protein
MLLVIDPECRPADSENAQQSGYVRPWLFNSLKISEYFGQALARM